MTAEQSCASLRQGLLSATCAETSVMGEGVAVPSSPFYEAVQKAIEGADRDQLQKLAGQVWKGFSAGSFTESEASRLAELIELRKALPVGPRPTASRRGSKPRSAASLDRRRRWVSAGLMPPQIACLFTMGEAAALAVVALEISKRRVCSLSIGQIGAIAGVSESTVRNALRAAKGHGLIQVKERRLRRYRNDTNLVTLTSAEWSSWLRIGPKRTGCKTVPGTTTKIHSQPFAPFKNAGNGKGHRSISGVPERGLRFGGGISRQ